MGLDISVYTKLTPAASDLDEDGNPTAPSTIVIRQDLIEWSDKFGGAKRTEGITAGIYAYEKSGGFRAGSYSGYNHWRSWLAEISGSGSAKSVWESGETEGPFFELINFADNEGYIGPVVAAKLAKDFAEFQGKAEAADENDGWNVKLYNEWRAAFEMAADGGLVDFH